LQQLKAKVLPLLVRIPLYYCCFFIIFLIKIYLFFLDLDDKAFTSLDRIATESIVLGHASAGRQSEARSDDTNGMQPDDQSASPAVCEGSMDVQIIESAGEDVTPEKKGNHCATETPDNKGILNKATDNDGAAKSAVEAMDSPGFTADTRSSSDAAKSATETPAGQGITAKNKSSGGGVKGAMKTPAGQGITTKNKNSGGGVKGAMKTPAGQGVKKKAMVSDGAKGTGMLRKVASNKRVTFAKITTNDEPMNVDSNPPKRPASPIPEDDSQTKPKKSRVNKASGKWHIKKK
jgi:hypothetical protein